MHTVHVYNYLHVHTATYIISTSDFNDGTSTKYMHCQWKLSIILKSRWKWNSSWEVLVWQPSKCVNVWYVRHNEMHKMCVCVCVFAYNLPLQWLHCVSSDCGLFVAGTTYWRVPVRRTAPRLHTAARLSPALSSMADLNTYIKRSMDVQSDRATRRNAR